MSIKTEQSPIKYLILSYCV